MCKPAYQTIFEGEKKKNKKQDQWAVGFMDAVWDRSEVLTLCSRRGDDLYHIVQRERL